MKVHQVAAEIRRSIGLAVEEVDDTALGAAIGEALEIVVEVATEAAAQTMATISFDCPKGKWCTAGLVVDCPVDTYNNLTGQDFATACQLCPMNSYTAEEASTSMDDCICEPGFYDSIAGPGVFCEICPTGTDCKGGATIDRLPLKPAFYRKSNTTIDVRKCPDAASNCSTNFGKPDCVSTSGCLGGESVEEQCNTTSTGLTGMFCMICEAPPAGAEQVYYVASTDDERAYCDVCGSTLGTTMGIVAGIVAGVLALSPLFFKLKRRYAKQLTYVNTTYSPLNKVGHTPEPARAVIRRPCEYRLSPRRSPLATRRRRRSSSLFT